jgi:electron transfer flavoprotein alpha subunit
MTAYLSDSDSGAADLASRGGGKVLVVTHESLKLFNDEVYSKVLKALIEKHTPDVILGPASFYGKALMGRLAAICGGAMISDITGLAMDGDKLTAIRPSYGGSVISRVVATGGTFFASVRGKMFAESKDGAGEVVAESVDSAAFEAKMKVTERKIESTGAVNITEADIIVSAGRGVKGPENLPMVKELATVLGGAVGASRAIVDADWAPYSQQVGQTGKTVNPKLYIAVGISGAIQHLVGMRSSQTIVAINRDKDAPIFNVANYGIVGDAMEIVPALTAKFKAEFGG